MSPGQADDLRDGQSFTCKYIMVDGNAHETTSALPVANAPRTGKLSPIPRPADRTQDGRHLVSNPVACAGRGEAEGGVASMRLGHSAEPVGLTRLPTYA